MRRVLVATLLLSPVLLHAQANKPAQPRTVALVQPSELSAASSADTTVRHARVSTGIVAPKLVHTIAIPTENSSFWARTALDRRFVVDMVVDATGKPSDLKIAESADVAEDRNVIDAVSQYRFTPGTVSNQPTSVPVSLEVVLKTQSGN